MVYSFELIKHANIRYRDSLVVLSRCELFAMLCSLGVTAEIREETLGGSRFLTVECRDLNESEIAICDNCLYLVLQTQKTTTKADLFFCDLRNLDEQDETLGVKRLMRVRKTAFFE